MLKVDYLIVLCLDPTSREYPDDMYQKLVKDDLADIDACDIVLAYCWKELTGTAMEIFYAWQNKKIVFIVTPSMVLLSPWLRYHATFIYQSLDDAIRDLRILA